MLGFAFHAPFMRLLGSMDSILPHGIEYSTWILIAAPAMASSCVMNNILRYEGKAFFAMLGLASGGTFHRYHCPAYPVLFPVFHAPFPIRKYALPEYRQKRQSHLSVHDSKRSGFYPGFMDLKHSVGAVWHPDLPGHLRCGIRFDHTTYGGEIFPVNARG